MPLFHLVGLALILFRWVRMRWVPLPVALEVNPDSLVIRVILSPLWGHTNKVWVHFWLTTLMRSLLSGFKELFKITLHKHNNKLPVLSGDLLMDLSLLQILTLRHWEKKTMAEAMEGGRKQEDSGEG